MTAIKTISAKQAAGQMLRTHINIQVCGLMTKIITGIRLLASIRTKRVVMQNTTLIRIWFAGLADMMARM